MANGFRLNHAALDDLLKGSEVRGELDRLTSRAARSAGRGFRSEVSTGRTRALGMVWPDTPEAIMSDRRNHSLMRSIDAMRGGS